MAAVGADTNLNTSPVQNQKLPITSCVSLQYIDDADDDIEEENLFFRRTKESRFVLCLSAIKREN